MSKLSFCLEAAKLHDDDASALTDSIEQYVKAGMSAEEAELAAVDDVLADVRAERQELIEAADVKLASQAKAAPPVSKARDEAMAIAKPVAQFLTTEEKAKLRRDTAKKLVDLFAQLPSGDEIAAIAWAGKAKRGWYRESAQALVHVYGADAPRFAALLAAMSPQTSVELDLINTVKTWKNWVKAGRPTDEESIIKVMGQSVQGNNLTKSVLPAWINNSVRALSAADPEHLVISGPKVNSFAANLRGVVNEVTNDAWMATFAAVDQKIFAGKLNEKGTDPGKGPGYLAMSARVRQAAKRLSKLTGETWTPAEVQETVWSWTKTVYEAQSKEVGARELVDNGDITDAMIAATPDFRTLLHEERYAQQIRETGLGRELDTLGSGGDDAAAGTRAQPGAAGQKAPFAAEAQGRYERAAADRLERVRDQRLAAGKSLSPVDDEEAAAQFSVDRGTGDGSRRDARGSLAPLEGAPTVQGAAGPDPRLVEVAHRYAREHGITLRRQAAYVKVDVERATRIAAAYDAMPHAPNDPKVKAAYADLLRQTREQYDALVDAGYKFTFFDSKTDPYDGNPWNSMRDLRANQRMAVYGTYDGYGTEGITQGMVDDNPMLVDTGLRWKDQGGEEHVVTGNDLFRAVHDAFGHGLEGAGFRADGEENAWQAHVRLFTGDAIGAITSETRGQNSWLNFGPYGEKNRTARLEDTVFADQKTGLMPEWTWSEGKVADEPHWVNQPRDEVGRFSRSRSNAPQTWASPDDTRLDDILFETQDSKIDLKRAQEAIAAAGRRIREQFDARQAETLYAGRVAYRTETFLESEVKPLLAAMHANKVGLTELGDYLLARHAPERNAQVAKVNPALPDGGAGTNSQGTLMTNQAARQYLARIPVSRRAQLDAVARRVDAITKGTRRLLVAEGLEKQETIDAWESAYPNYVPLFKDESEGNPHPIGNGFSVRGAASKRATGSTAQVTNVLSHVLMQREAALTRSEKNRVGLSLYGLALTHPNPDFWTVIRPSMSAKKIRTELMSVGINPNLLVGMDPVPTVRGVDETTGLVVDRPNPLYKSMPGAIVLRVNGEDRVLMFNEKNARALRLAQDMKNLDGLLRTEVVAKTIGRATRWFAAVNTQYNPAFGLVNFSRDVMAGTVNLTNTPLRRQKTKVLANVPAALVGIARDLRGDAARTPWSDTWNEFQAAGGQTGYRELFRTADARAKQIERELASIDRATAGKVGHAVLDLLDDFNTALENAVRLSAYKAALDQGMSKAAAARLGRELTVDFNRKGRTGREVNPVYAFFNASVQGTERILRTLAGPAGNRIIVGGLSAGVAQALLLAAAGYEEDDIPEYVKARAFIIPLPPFEDKRYIAIPLALGLHVLPNTGRVLTELAMSGGDDFGPKTFNALGEIAGAFNPLGGGNIFTADGALRTLSFTVTDPLVDLATNKNFAGRPIEKKAFSDADNRPGYERARESTERTATGQAYIGISKAINALTLGNKYEAGGISWTPERYRYLAHQVGGGILRELEKAVDSSVAAMRGEEVDARMIPVSSRFVGQVDQAQATEAAYYESRRRFKKIESSYKAAEKAGDTAFLDKMDAKHPELKYMKDLERAEKDLRKLTKEANETVGDRKRLAEIDQERTEVMADFNKAVREMELASSKKAPPALNRAVEEASKD